MNTFYIILIALAVATIAGLGWYAWHLTQKVREQERQQQEETAKAEQQLRQYQLGLMEDVHFVCKAVLTEQCEITEGVLRLQYLIRGLDPDVWNARELQGLRTFYSLIKDMPILDAYKELTRKEQFRLDNERWRLEEAHKADILRELQWIMDYRFPTVTLVH